MLTHPLSLRNVSHLKRYLVAGLSMGSECYVNSGQNHEMYYSEGKAIKSRKDCRLRNLPPTSCFLCLVMVMWVLCIPQMLVFVLNRRLQSESQNCCNSNPRNDTHTHYLFHSLTHTVSPRQSSNCQGLAEEEVTVKILLTHANTDRVRQGEAYDHKNCLTVWMPHLQVY